MQYNCQYENSREMGCEPRTQMINFEVTRNYTNSN